MTFLRVAVDDVEVATVGTHRRDVVAIRVGGTRVDDQYADLDVTGGNYDHEGTTDHRIWIEGMPLRIGQVVGVSFIEHTPRTGDGRAFVELYPDRGEVRIARLVDRAELAEGLRQAAKRRSGYELRLVLPDGSARSLSTAPEEHGFGFNALWNNIHPDRVSVSLYAHTLDTIATEPRGRTAAQEKMLLGGAARLELIG